MIRLLAVLLLCVLALQGCGGGCFSETAQRAEGCFH